MAHPQADWRDEAASALVLKHLDMLDAPGPVLVLQDLRDDVAAALEARGRRVVRWNRRALGGRPASPWPPAAVEEGGGFASAFLRLPRAKDELEMAVHAAVHRLRPGAPLYVYGAKDEGAGSAPGRMEPVLEEVATVATGGRCRLLEGWRTTDPAGPPGLRAGLEAWRIETTPPHRQIPGEVWVTYPGLFATGRLDEGTALLLDALEEAELTWGAAHPTDAADAPPRVLDFACGDGIVGALVKQRRPGVVLDLLEVDAVALAAARENVGEGLAGEESLRDESLPDESLGAGRFILGDGPSAVGEAHYDLIVANPPYHGGKAETTGVVEALIRAAPGLLRPGGELWMVIQRRLSMEAHLQAAFQQVDAVADRGAFRVWRGRG